jgi:hypothetical protein
MCCGNVGGVFSVHNPTAVLEKEIYLVVGVNVFVGIGFVMTWARLEIITETIELT